MQLIGSSTADGSGAPRIALSCHLPGNGPQFLSLEGTEHPWRAPLLKGQGWHDFVLKVYHRASAGTINMWYRPPGRVNYSKVITNYQDSTWEGSRFYWKLGYYRGANDPAGAEPWTDIRGGVMSSCHQVDPACWFWRSCAHFFSGLVRFHRYRERTEQYRKRKRAQVVFVVGLLLLNGGAQAGACIASAFVFLVACIRALDTESYRKRERDVPYPPGSGPGPMAPF
jgi:hypothetical protein